MILQDEKLEALLERTYQVEGLYREGQVMVVGYDASGENQCVQIYTCQEDFERKFPQRRASLNGRIVTHKFGTPEYECLTDIADKETEHHGEWKLSSLIDGEWKKAYSPTKEELLKHKEALLKGSEVIIFHKVGTTDYTVLYPEEKTAPQGAD